MIGPIVFLDLDGVLMPIRKRWRPAPLPFRLMNPFCAAAVAELNVLTNATGALLCLVSTWRTRKGVPELAAVLARAGVRGEVFGSTVDWGGPRAREIGQWLDDHPARRPFVILDDDPHGDLAASQRLSGSLVRPDPYVGLTAADTAKAMQLLVVPRDNSATISSSCEVNRS
jgi:hypothetical protein